MVTSCAKIRKMLDISIICHLSCQNPQLNHNSTQRNITLSWVRHENETLKVTFWEHLEQIPTIKLTFVHETFVLVTFVHIRIILAVTDPILMKL